MESMWKRQLPSLPLLTEEFYCCLTTKTNRFCFSPRGWFPVFGLGLGFGLVVGLGFDLVFCFSLMLQSIRIEVAAEIFGTKAEHAEPII